MLCKNKVLHLYQRKELITTTKIITIMKTKRTYTIRVFEGGKLVNEYRSNVQSKSDFTEFWTENDIIAFLKYSNDYYSVK